MTQHMQRELELLKKKLLELCALVEENVERSVRSFREMNHALAKETIEVDSKVDQMEVEVEEECLKLLALYQPVAIDLRFIIVVLKINNDLERVGDMAVNMAIQTLLLMKKEKISFNDEIHDMAEMVQSALKHSLDSLVNMDIEIAKKIFVTEEKIDEIYHGIYDKIKVAIENHDYEIDSLLKYLLVVRNLERIADHATNIAEDVIYMLEGEIVRHRIRDYVEKENQKTNE